MRTIIYFTAGAALGWALAGGIRYHRAYQEGMEMGEQTSSVYYEGQIANRVEDGIKAYQRVQAIREQSEYQKGKDSCHE